MTAGGIAGCQGRRLNPMLRHCLILSLLVLPATSYADTPAPLPPAVRDMLAASIASGNATDIDTVARIAKQTNIGTASCREDMCKSAKFSVVDGPEKKK